MDSNPATSAEQPVKTCKICGQVKPLSDFHSNRNTKDNRNIYCKPCANHQARSNHHENRDERLQRMMAYYRDNKPYFHYLSKKWAAENPEKRREISRKWCSENRESNREKGRQRYRNNPAKYKAWQANNYDKVRQMKANWRKKHGREYSKEYRAKGRQATPQWADMAYMNDLYRGCRELEQTFGSVGLFREYHVDHIVPLQSEVVCGLHCPDNLQVLEASENRAKSNRLKI